MNANHGKQIAHALALREAEMQRELEQSPFARCCALVLLGVLQLFDDQPARPVYEETVRFEVKEIRYLR